MDADESLQKRKAWEAWLEAQYDLNTAKGIQSIPERSDLPRPPDADSGGFRNYTCDVDYYLRFKAEVGMLILLTHTTIQNNKKRRTNGS